MTDLQVSMSATAVGRLWERQREIGAPLLSNARTKGPTDCSGIIDHSGSAVAVSFYVAAGFSLGNRVHQGS
jgi:hypothetical protein